MAQSLAAIFTAFRAMPYYKNHAAASGAVHNFAKHEEALAQVMKANGYTKFVTTKKMKKNDQYKENFLADMPPASFIEQPFGTHSSPDFFVKGPSGKLIPLEAKSSETAFHPTYNSGGIKRGYYYVFCSKKTNQTTIFRGDDIITQEQERMISEYIAGCRARDIEFNKRLRALDINNRGITWYTRPMINQSGGKKFTNYYIHENKERDEERVITSLQ